MGVTVAEIKKRLSEADAEELAVLERALVADERKGVRSALAVAKRRLQAEANEEARLASMYSFERSLCGENPHAVVVGLDEVGRGPLAGPLAVGAVVLPADLKIAGLNDSKQVKPADRERIAAEVKRVALAWDVHYVEPSYIDDHGMTASLRLAFSSAVKAIEQAGVRPDVILLDGNPLHLDPREVNVVKGDGKCASIAAASIVAKVERDALMCRYAESYPEYHFAENKRLCKSSPHRRHRARGLKPHSPQELLHGVHAANAVLARFSPLLRTRLRPPTPVRRIAVA